jgi:ATP-binding cassette subfamily B protein
MTDEEDERNASLRPLLAHAVRHWRYYLLGFVTLFAVDFMSTQILTRLIAVPFGKWERGEHATPTALLSIAGAYIGVSVAQVGLRYLWRYGFYFGAEKIAYEIREAFFAKIQKLPIAFFDRAKTGDLMSRATNDLDQVRGALGTGALLVFDCACYFVMVPYLLISISPWLTFVLFLTVAIVPFSFYKIGKVVHARSKVVQDVFGKLSARLQENFSGIRVVQSFAQEDREVERFDEVGRAYLDANLAEARIRAFSNPFWELFFDGAYAVVLLFGAREVIGGRLSIELLVVFTRALDHLIWPLMALGWLMNVMQRGAAAHGRIETILRQADDPSFRDTRPARPVEGAVEARDLTFTYPLAKRASLEHVSFSVPAGAFVAVVGPVGSGKTTLLSLLARLYEPEAGQLFIDGTDVREVPTAALRSSVALVPQETFLFSASIEENVKLGRQGELTHEQVERAARAAQVDGEIASVPNGYDALLGERGVNLSGGQRQRVAIARALVRTPRILLLDDALSAVDTATETAIDAELRANGDSPPTRFVATHRLAAARAADLVLVLDQGRLVERGTHKDLVEKGGLYARLARRDALEEEVARA